MLPPPEMAISDIRITRSKVVWWSVGKAPVGVLHKLQDYVHINRLLPGFDGILLFVITSMVVSATVAVRRFPRISWNSFKPELGYFKMAQRGTSIPLADQSVDILPFWTMAIFKFSASRATTLPLPDYLCMEVLLGGRDRLRRGK